MPPPIVHVESIPDEGMTVPVALEPSWLRGALEDTGFVPAGATPGEISVRLDRDKRDVTLSGHFTVRLGAECVACLTQFELDVEGDLDLVLEPAPSTPARPRAEVELTPGELTVDIYEDNKIDLARWIREAILVEAPTHPRHPGECPVSLTVSQPAPEQEAKDVDPRLLPLRGLFSSHKE